MGRKQRKRREDPADLCPPMDNVSESLGKRLHDSCSDDTDSEPSAKLPRTEITNVNVKTSANLPHKRKARLIVRNLSFKATEDKLKTHFCEFGELTDVKILRRPDGRLVGCGFVEYKLKQNAAKALAHTSGQPFLSRPIVVDWAVPKDKFLQKTQGKSNYDSEESGFNDGELKEQEDNQLLKDYVKEGNEDSNDDDDGNGDDDSCENEQSSDEDEGVHNNADDSEDENKDNMEITGQRKPRRESHDLSEGCTVFVKNIPFTVDNQELKKCMQQYGPIYYALICMDPLTEHSKGTGFVKYRTKDSAEACLEAGDRGEIVIRSTVLETQRALSREEVISGKKKDDTKKDGRNLYLIKEGVILAGSPAASGVSKTDMAKRLQLEQWKTQMLRNLNKFVSRNRLVIHNLPSSFDDQQLRSMCLKYGGPKAVISEARVMRDFRNVDASGKAISKGFGFVSFTSHENALQALRNLNNNPNIFSPASRPVVAFSIEDRVALNVRQKRLEKSKAHQPQEVNQRDWESNRKLPKETPQKLGSMEQRSSSTQQENSNKQQQKGGKLTKNEKKRLKKLAQQEGTKPIVNPPQQTQSQEPQTRSRKDRRKLRQQKRLETQKQRQMTKQSAVGEGTRGNFAGEQAKPGYTKTMSKQALQEQAQLHNKTVKILNKKERLKKQMASAKIKQPKQKMGKSKDLKKEDNFSSLVKKYKDQLSSAESERKKWYD